MAASSRFYNRAGQQTEELTIEQQRKLGLSDGQIQKIAEKRRELEKERAGLDKQLKAARESAAAANAEVARLSKEIRTILTLKIRKVYESVMNKAQLKEWNQQRYLQQAKRWLVRYKGWLKLTDAQMDDIGQLLVPAYQKYEKMEGELADARERVSELWQVDKVDVKAIEEAEKKVDELSKRNIYRLRDGELREKMRAGLMPEQLEKFDRVRRR